MVSLAAGTLELVLRVVYEVVLGETCVLRHPRHRAGKVYEHLRRVDDQDLRTNGTGVEVR